MRAARLPILLAATLPALAGAEVGLLFDRMTTKAHMVLVSQTAVNGNYDAGSLSGTGIRVGTTFIDLKVLSVGVNATWHPKSEQDLNLNGARIGKYGAQYIALGAGLDWKLLLNLHAGVEFRRETYSADFPAWGSLGSTSLTRPWAKVGVGFSVPLPLVSPFVRLELAMPTTKTDKTSTPDDLRQALAPQAQVAIYAGVRF